MNARRREERGEGGDRGKTTGSIVLSPGGDCALRSTQGNPKKQKKGVKEAFWLAEGWLIV